MPEVEVVATLQEILVSDADFNAQLQKVPCWGKTAPDKIFSLKQRPRLFTAIEVDPVIGDTLNKLELVWHSMAGSLDLGQG